MSKNQTDEERLIELLFFAYRDFTADPDRILAALGFGRAHHRVMHFIDRSPGLTVAELLELLGITKQSLARVLRQLIDGGYVAQREGINDRRHRQLHLTAKGDDLIDGLRRPQSRRIKQALSVSGVEPQIVEKFLRQMINVEGRGQIAKLD